MKKKSLFKNRIQMVIYIILTIICLSLFIIIGKTDFKKDNDNEAIKFSNLYNLVGDDNLFVFSNATDVLNIINGRSGVILFGFPKNIWVNKYASILNEVAKEMNIDKIYYYDFYNDRVESNATYETIVQKLSMYAPVDDLGKQDIMAPTVVIIKNGTVVAYFDDVSIIKGKISLDIYFNENQVSMIRESFKTAFNEYNNMR